jgi:hypothetical protein
VINRTCVVKLSCLTGEQPRWIPPLCAEIGDIVGL